MLTTVSGPSARDLAAISELEHRVVAADGGRLKLEWGALRSRDSTRVTDLLWWDRDRLVGFCGLYGFGTQIEVAGMVDPLFRRSGIGSALLDAALPLAAELGAPGVLLVTPRTTAAGAAFAMRHAGVLDHSEHFLVLGDTPTPPTHHEDVMIRDAATADVGDVRRVLAAAFGPTPDEFPVLPRGERERQLVLQRGDQVVGCLRLNASSPGTTGIYGFAVLPELQGQGIGRAVLRRVCHGLRAAGTPEVTLEVAVDNDHALRLYTSVGFVQRATEDYYAVAAAASAPVPG